MIPLIPLYDFGGAGQLLHFAPANGFPPATYTPLLERFTADYHVLSVLPRAFWGEKPPQQLFNWKEQLAVDLLNGLREHELTEVIGIGHSFGAIASVLAAIEEPQRFKALILLDPTIFTPALGDMLKQMQEQGIADQMPLAARAIKRQKDFEDEDEAFAYFREKRLFQDWSDDMLWAYVKYGTVVSDTGLTLAWPPEWEAYYFSTGYTGVWDDLPALHETQIPMLILRGEDSDTYLPESAERVKQILPNADHLEVRGGHLFPQAHPDMTCDLIADWLGAHR